MFGGLEVDGGNGGRGDSDAVVLDGVCVKDS